MERSAAAEGFDAGVIFGADECIMRWPIHKPALTDHLRQVLARTRRSSGARTTSVCGGEPDVVGVER